MGSFTESIYWSVRSWLWNYPVSSDESIWNKVEDPSNRKLWVAGREATVKKWYFLRPFFAGRGYDLYVVDGEPNNVFEQRPSPTSVKQNLSSKYPYAEFLGVETDEIPFLNGVSGF
jgi:hypothetical protein